MTILVLGNGWIGSILKEYLKADAFGPKLTDGMNIPESIWNRYDVIINTIAKTNIDWCEKNKVETANVNITLAVNLAERCVKTGKKYVFFSSACIFESKNSRDIKYEDSTPNPACFYAKTKAIAEELVLETNPNTLIIRPRLPLSEVPHPRNTINKLLSYEKLQNNQESVTVVEDMLPALKSLIEKGESGVINMVNAGTISPVQIRRGFDKNFTACSKEEQDERLAKEGRARRVTTYVGSKRVPLLPDIRQRIKTVIEKYKSYERLNKEVTR